MKNIEKYNDMLKDLRFQKDGNIIIAGGDGENKFRINVAFVKSDEKP